MKQNLITEKLVISEVGDRCQVFNRSAHLWLIRFLKAAVDWLVINGKEKKTQGIVLCNFTWTRTPF